MSAAATDRNSRETPSSEDVRAQLGRIVASQTFQAQKRRSAFLTYVVEEALAGRTHRLKGVSIAMSVFDRDETFDQRVDPIVRLEARRLRSELDSYYATDGRWDPLRITLPKGGYVPSFAWQETEAVPDAAPPAEPPAALPQGRHGIAALRSRPRLLALGLLVLSLAAGVAGVLRFDLGTDKQAAALGSVVGDPLLALPKGPSIAVLPFLNLSGDRDKQYIVDGFTEQLTDALARFRDIWVLPFGATKAYKGGLTDPRTLHRDFGTAYVLEGSVRIGAGDIRIASRLIDAEGARYIWVRSFDAAFTPADLYDLQDEIAEQVAGNLAGEYGVLAQGDMVMSKRKPPESLDAYDCVLRYYDYQTAIAAAQHASVKSCLERAVAAEPNYAEAWALLANVYMQEKRFWVEETAGDEAASAAKAKAAAERAVALEPDNATAQMMLSNLLFTEGDFDGFRRAGEAALALNPNSSDALAHYALRIGILGDWDRALALADKAMLLNPLHPGWYRFTPVLHAIDTSDDAVALAELDRIDMPAFFWTHLLRAAALGQLGRRDEAAAAVRTLLALKPNFAHDGAGFLQVWHFSPQLHGRICNGLARAGLTIDDAT